METRYPVLRFISVLYKVIGVITGLMTLLSCVFLPIAYGTATSAMSGGLQGGGAGTVTGIFMAFFVFLYGSVIAITLYAFGEGIHLALALEENTRATAMVVQRQVVGPIQ